MLAHTTSAQKAFARLNGSPIGLAQVEPGHSVAFFKVRLGATTYDGLITFEKDSGQRQATGAFLLDQGGQVVKALQLPMDLCSKPNEESERCFGGAGRVLHSSLATFDIQPIQRKDRQAHLQVCEVVSCLLASMGATKQQHDYVIDDLRTSRASFNEFSYHTSSDFIFHAVAKSGKGPKLLLEGDEIRDCFMTMYHLVDEKTRFVLAYCLYSEKIAEPAIMARAFRSIARQPNYWEAIAISDYFFKEQEHTVHRFFLKKFNSTKNYGSVEDQEEIGLLALSCLVVRPESFFTGSGQQLTDQIVATLITPADDKKLSSFVSQLTSICEGKKGAHEFARNLTEELISRKMFAIADRWATAYADHMKSPQSYACEARAIGLEMIANGYSDRKARGDLETVLGEYLESKKGDAFSDAQAASAAHVLGKYRLEKDLLHKVFIQSGSSSIPALIIATELAANILPVTPVGAGSAKLLTFDTFCKKLLELRHYSYAYVQGLRRNLIDNGHKDKEILVSLVMQKMLRLLTEEKISRDSKMERDYPYRGQRKKRYNK